MNPDQSLIFILVTLCQAICVGGEVFTAMADMEALLNKEQNVVQVVDRYIEQEKLRLEKLKQAATDYADDNEVVSNMGSQYFSNPVNAFQLVRKLTTNWNGVRRLIENNAADEFIKNITRQREDWSVKFPSNEDLNGAADALLRLQDTYQLTTRDMTKGNVGTVSAQPLTAVDCFQIGRSAYLNRDYYHTIMWMQEAVDLIDKGDETATESEVLEHLAYALFQQGNIRRAYHVTKRLVHVDPGHPRGQGNLHYYETEMKNEGLRDKGKLPPINNPRQNVDSAHLKYEKLCRGEVPVPPSVEKTHYCYYKTNRPFLKIAPLKVEIINWKPKVVIFRQVLSDREISKIKELAFPKLNRATIHNRETGALEPASYRISKSAWLKEEDDAVVERVNSRLDLMTDLNMETAELLQIANYGIGGHYEPHFDMSTPDERDAFGEDGNRIATVLFYMSQPEAGGATVFLSHNLALFPSKNDAAFWHNLLPNGAPDLTTRHAACPVLAGVKWVSNKWIHERGQEFRRPCEMTKDYKE